MNLQEAATAIRQVESGGDYTYYQDFFINGNADTKVGAYGFLLSRWGLLTEALGLGGAPWQDFHVQDVVAHAKIQSDAQQLGGFDMTPVSFRFGVKPVRAAIDAGYVTAADFEKDERFAPLAEYMKNLEKNVSTAGIAPEGQINDPYAKGVNKAPSEAQGKAASILRRRIEEMAGREPQQGGGQYGREASPEPVEEPERFMYPTVEEGGPRIPYWNQNPDMMNRFKELRRSMQPGARIETDATSYAQRRGLGRVMPPDEAKARKQPISDRGNVERIPQQGGPRESTDNRPTPV